MPIINSVIKGKQPQIESLNVTPTTSAQTINAPTGKDGYAPVNVSAVTSSIDENIVAGNIKDGVTILGVTGDYQGGITPTGTKQITYNGTHDVTNYANAEVQVPTTAPQICSVPYTIVSNGSLKLDKNYPVQNLSGLKHINFSNFFYQLYNGRQDVVGVVDLSSLISTNSECAFLQCWGSCPNITSVDLSNLVYIGGNLYNFQYAFNNSGITSVDLRSFEGLYSNSGYAFDYAFRNCMSLTTVNLDSFVYTPHSNNYNQCFSYAFAGCTSLTDASWLSHLTFHGMDMQYTFQNCPISGAIRFDKLYDLWGSFSYAFSGTSITDIYFPKLTVSSHLSNNCFANLLSGVTGCTVHFPAGLQSIISRYASYATGFGGTNSIILFDLTDITIVDLTHLKPHIVGQSEFSSGLYQHTTITKVDLSNLLTVGYDSKGAFLAVGANSAFGSLCDGCSALADFDVSSLIINRAPNSFNYAFRNCTSLTTMTWDSLRMGSIQQYSAQPMCYMYSGCTSLQSLYFPALGMFARNSTKLFDGILTGCSNVTVHFPSNLQSYISNWSSVTRGFGGTNTTILYDLPASNDLKGADTNEYMRNPKYDTETALAWRKDELDLTTSYYTSGLTDPTVGTTIYSDAACTTAVTTVSEVLPIKAIYLD